MKNRFEIMILVLWIIYLVLCSIFVFATDKQPTWIMVFCPTLGVICEMIQCLLYKENK